MVPGRYRSRPGQPVRSKVLCVKVGKAHREKTIDPDTAGFVVVYSRMGLAVHGASAHEFRARRGITERSRRPMQCPTRKNCMVGWRDRPTTLGVTMSCEPRRISRRFPPRPGSGISAPNSGQPGTKPGLSVRPRPTCAERRTACARRLLAEGQGFESRLPDPELLVRFSPKRPKRRQLRVTDLARPMAVCYPSQPSTLYVEEAVCQASGRCRHLHHDAASHSRSC